MDRQLRGRLAFHGLAIFVLGLLIAIPFAMVFSKSGDAHTHLWNVAHLEALTHGLLLMGLGAIGHLIVLPPSHERRAVTLVVTGAYASTIGATIGAAYDVLGLKPGHGAANTVAWAFLGYGTVAVSVALVWLLWGARRGERALEASGPAADGDPAGTKVIVVPQFGSGPRREVVVEPASWVNWGGTLTADPVRVQRPHSFDELCDQVREARLNGFSIRAVGGGFSWSPGAVTDGVLIDMSNLDRVIRTEPASEGRPATVTVESGTTVHSLTEHAASHGLTLATTTVIPWVQVGGAVANGCHGTGRDVATFPDLVVAMDVVGSDGCMTHYERDGSDTWRALLVGLGALGIVYSLTFECVPMYRVHAVDTVMPMTDAVARMQELAMQHEAFELFWFPFNTDALVKTWDRTELPATEHLPRRAWDDFVELLDDALSRPLRSALELDPALTPSVCRAMFSLMPKLDVVCPVPWAMQYQTSFAPVVDTSWAIPLDPTFTAAREAWNRAVEQVSAWAQRGAFPQNMVLHARFVGRPSDALLSPTVGHELGSCLIEALTFRGTRGLDEYFAELGRTWASLGGRPHWAKLMYEVDFGALYGEDLDRFRAVRDRLDPEGVFLNPFLERVLGSRQAASVAAPTGAA